MSDNGLISVPSEFTTGATMERLLAALRSHNMTVFARIDHAANASAAGMTLRPTEVVIFGNPKGGTVLMQEEQRIGLDLPLKALVWQDAAGKAWVGYTDPVWLARRYGVSAGGAVEGMAGAMKAIAQAATRRDGPEK